VEGIDAAVVKSVGPSYEPFPTTEAKQIVAREVIDALELDRTRIEIDLSNGVRYHQVGFSIHRGESALLVSLPVGVTLSPSRKATS
jgi:hypothetical protein